ncbi:MAG: hypothetical protein DRN27_05580 [Thermoplasmata archaeon]|nr:MAG: hypothetical protein DRN27_05580 [Thermoplasmata archaeon]
MSFEEYQDLQGTGFQGGSGEKIAPEDEFFHSVYISGKTRKNHLNIEEKIEHFQIRGVEYNLSEVNMIITHTKEILAKIENERGRDTIICFSFKEGTPPWKGSSKLANGEIRTCPMTSAERATVDFCNACRSQLLVAGIYCNKNGSPILTDDKKPIFIFIRGKGMKYSNISEYLNNLYNEDLPPIFEPVTEQSKMFEKSVVNQKRYVTNITRTTATSSYNNEVNIFAMKKGAELPKDAVLKILKLSKDTVGKFNEKFDWSKSKQAQTTGYGAKTDGILTTETPSPETETPLPETPAKQQEVTPEDEKTFSFDDIQF